MSDSPSVLDRIHYANRRAYTKKQGNVVYLDGKPLMRPAEMPLAQKVIALVFVIIGIAIGVYIVNNVVVARWQETISTEQTIANNLAREASISTIPQVWTLITLDNEGVKATFNEAGYSFYDASPQDESGDLVLYKIPSDMTVDEAAVMFMQGIGGLSAEQASKLLNGSWMFAAERVNGTSMVVRYADFTTGDPQIAVQNAIVKEGFDPTSITESGVDDSGNTFSAGTSQVGETIYNWKVSALKLDEMYSIPGLPDNACYVGIRMTGA